MKVSEEFVIGKNNIGWVSSDFTKEYGDMEILPGIPLQFQKLTKRMTDSEIFSELKVQECTLGDVLEVIKNATDEMKDGYANLFYIKGHPSRVVFVYWHDSEWHVYDWHRAGHWNAGRRVFSPATSDPLVSYPMSSDTLKLAGYCECERCEKCKKLLST